MKVTVENEFWQVFPEGQISVLVVKGLDNRVDESKDPYFKSLLDKGAKRADPLSKLCSSGSVRGVNFIQSILWLISTTVSRCLMRFHVAVRIWIRLSEVFI